ncbi:cytochrome c biogenesis heme-transporting ATPase CcmA [Vibrio sp.]|nr:cytochrome c biogenesis heme-transporting ATPase CcmA [Vibrio sp.]
MLTVNDLTMIRDENTLFTALSFNVNSGDLIQVEGRNGTGKTTLLRIISGLATPDEGTITFDGQLIQHDREHYHRNLLYIGHHTGVKRDLTAYENLQFYVTLHSPKTQTQDAIFYALAKVGLAGREDVLVSQLSAGQQRRVALARLWLSEHRLWILDEPLTAIDKQGVKVLEALFVEHVKKGNAILFTTHQDILTESGYLTRISLGESS